MNTATVISVIPRHIVRAFTIAPKVDHIRLDHRDGCSRNQLDEEVYDTRRALESAGFRVADSAATLLVFAPLPEPERCEHCGAPTPPACKCKDLVTE